MKEDESIAGPSQPRVAVTPKGNGPSGGALRKTSSRLGSAMARVRSTDAHPPHHAHFDLPLLSTHASNLKSDPLEDSRTASGHTADPEIGSPTDPKGPGNTDDPDGQQAGKDVEKDIPVPVPILDIEHMPCDDDPRRWNYFKKHFVLAMVTFAFLGPLLATSIYNPVLEQIQTELHATNVQIGLSLSLYILCQGWFPILWATLAEIIGRKLVYLSSYCLYTIATVIASRSPNMPTLVAMRAVMAIGSAAVTCLGAGTLADIFEVHERGKKLGFFYGVSLVGPAIGPFLGGLLGHAFGWRSTLYFLAAYAAIVDGMFILFPDSWRKERSRIYQTAVRNAVKRAMHQTEVADRKRAKKLALGLPSTAATPLETISPETSTRRQSLAATSSHIGIDGTLIDEASATPSGRGVAVDMEHRRVTVSRRWPWSKKPRPASATETETETFRPSLRDVNPLPSMWSIAKLPTNDVMIGCSGLLFGAQYCIPYTASLTLAKEPYNYNAFNIGLIVLAFGGGSLIGSVIGGRLSDRALSKSRKINKGINIPEFRLRSAIPFMPFMVGSFLAYGWTAEKHVHIAGITVVLFCCGLFLMLVYSTAFAYIVDSNPGRSSSAVSINSVVRGSIGCILSQVAIPIQNGIGDGGLYTLVASLLAVGCGGITLTMLKGASWRDPEHRFNWLWRNNAEAVVPLAPVVHVAESSSVDGRSEKSIVAPVS